MRSACLGAVMYLMAAIVLVLGSIPAHGLPKVIIVGDSRTVEAHGYTQYMGPYISGVATISAVRIDAFVGSFIPKISGFKGAAMVHFMGGLDDLTALDCNTDAERQQRYNRYVAEMENAMKKMKAELSGTKIVHATMFKVASCSERGRDCATGCRRRNDDVVWFNGGSVKVANAQGVKVHDLYTFSKGFTQSDERHFDKTGAVKIAQEVANFIKSNLSTVVVSDLKVHTAFRGDQESGSVVLFTFLSDRQWDSPLETRTLDLQGRRTFAALPRAQTANVLLDTRR